MKLAIISSLLASSAAFAPTQQTAFSATALNAYEDDYGVTEPLGLWDPMGLLKKADQSKFDRLRYVEVKHGRIAQLAVVGYLMNKRGIYLGGDIDYHGNKFSDMGSGFEVFNKIPIAGLVQTVLFIGFLELFVMKDITGSEFPGDFRNDYIDFGWDNFSDEEKEWQKKLELNQGRAAQMGILGLMVHEQLGNTADLFTYMN